MFKRGDIWWAELGEPRGSGPGFRRPVLIVSDNRFNASAIQTILAAIITSNLKLAAAPANVLVPARASGLAQSSVVNLSQITTLDKTFLMERVTRLPERYLREVDTGLRLIMSLG